MVNKSVYTSNFNQNSVQDGCASVQDELFLCEMRVQDVRDVQGVFELF